MSNYDDRRTDERSDCCLSASIEIDGRSKIPCIVKDLSAAGAKIRVDDAIDLPKQFDLLIPAIPGVDQRFRVVTRWRQAGILGGAFVTNA